MSGIPIVQVDAFAQRPFEGNPAAVCLLEQPADATWMQKVAAEMNLSETAFVVRAGGDVLSLRWFTPKCEVDLCGHATLATAHVLWEEGWLAAAEQARFETLSGPLLARQRNDEIELDFPADPPVPTEPPEGLAAALGVEPVRFARSRAFHLAELQSERAVRELRPDFRKIVELDLRGPIVTAEAETPGADFVSRFFAPAVGIDEDPVTGSAHCALGPWWQARLEKNPLRGYQASTRGGFVGVEVTGDRVLLRGTAVTVMRSTLVRA